MPRGSDSWFNARTTLAAMLALLGLCAVLPPSVIKHARLLQGPVDLLRGPIQQPLYRLVLLVKGPAEDDAKEGPKVRALEELVESLRQQLLSANKRIEDLQRAMAELEGGLALNPGLNVRQFIAPVLGPAADLSSGQLAVRAGSREGVETNAVVVTRGLQLVGRITSVGPRTSTVLPITVAAAGQLNAVIMLDDLTLGPKVPVLKPTGRGTLEGKVFDTFNPVTGQPAEITPGMSVRLLDDNAEWPASARMLFIGVIESVRPADDNPLSRVVTVRPAYQVDRVGEVTIRMLGTSPSEKSGGNP